LIPSVYPKPTLKGDFMNEAIGDEAIYLRIAQFEKGLIQWILPTPIDCSLSTGQTFATTPSGKMADPERL
jgi:hypothetical protein